MNYLLIGLIALALVATVLSFWIGMGSMLEGEEYDKKNSTQLMFARVGFQALAIVLVIIAIFIGVK